MIRVVTTLSKSNNTLLNLTTFFTSQPSQSMILINNFLLVLQSR